MSEEPAGGSAGRALLAGGLLSLLGFLLLTAVVAQQHFAGADLAARSLVHQSHHPALTSVMEGASFLGGRPGQIALIGAGFATLWPGRRRWALGLPLVMAGVGAVQFLAKWAVDRPRPNLDSWGFPSAHVLSLVVLCGYLAYAVTLGTSRGQRRLAMGAGAVIVGTVAYSRMYLDAHFLSDVLGGLMAGLAYLSGAIWTVGCVPRVRRALPATPAARPAETLLIPGSPGPATDPLVAAVPAVAMAPAMPGGDAG
jgi:membrane-associated phospholipid phosphatase